MNLFLLAALLAIGGPADSSQCRTIHLNPAPRMFNAPVWDVSGDRLLLADVASGEIDIYGISGERERSVVDPGPEELNFSAANTIVALGSQYVLGDGSSRFLLLDRTLKPIQAHDLDDDRRSGRWRAAPFLWAPLDAGLIAYGDVLSSDGHWKTGIFRISWDGPLKLDFLREMPGSSAKEPYLLGSTYVVRLGHRVYAFSFEPEYGLIQVDQQDVRLLKGLPAGFGMLPHLPQSHGRASMPTMYAAFSRSEGVVGLVAAGKRLYLLLRDIDRSRQRRWFLAQYDPVRQKTIALLLLPTTADHVELAAGNKWLAVIEKGPFLADERFALGSVILVPTARLQSLEAAGGTIEAPKPLCGPLTAPAAVH